MSKAPYTPPAIREVALIVWNTRPDGVVEISEDGEHYTVPTLDQVEASKMGGCLRWDELVAEIADAHGVPRAFVMGIMRDESGGDPKAHNPDGGMGLMQITGGLKGKHTDDELADPRLNLTIGVGLMASILRGGLGIDLPALASMYNAGQPCIFQGNYVPCGSHPGAVPSNRPWSNAAWIANGRHMSDLSRWGFACQGGGYIDEVVKGANWYNLRRLGTT